MKPDLKINVEDIVELGHFAALQIGIHHGIEVSGKHLDLGNFRLNVRMARSSSRSLLVSASCRMPQAVDVFLNSACGNFPKPEILSKIISSSLSHEFHHMVRMRKWLFRFDMFGEMFIAEGMAECFSVQTGHDHITSLTKVAAMRMLARARRTLGKPFSYDDWFVTAGGKTLFPAGGGYDLAGGVVNSYLKATGLQASDIVHLDAREILGPWKTGKLDVFSRSNRHSVRRLLRPRHLIISR